MILDVLTFAASFLIALILYPIAIDTLRRMRSGQVIQAELPESHQKKAGTPTGGGILFAGLGILGGIVAAINGHVGAWPAVAGLVAGGLIGFADDQSKVRVGSRGIPARLKLPIQLLLAIPVAAVALSQGGIHQHLLPSTPWLLYPLAVVAIVATANAVNITDGIDGLAGGLSAIAFAAIALLLPGALAGEKAVAMTLAGALVAFLVYNRYPARVFMGDTGSLGVGYALFKMTPIHYTFHHEGWSENRIALSFWGAGLVSALAAAGVARLIS